MEIIKTQGCANYCFECNEKKKVVIELGEDVDYDSNTTWICFDCLKKAYEMMEKETEENER